MRVHASSGEVGRLSRRAPPDDSPLEAAYSSPCGSCPETGGQSSASTSVPLETGDDFEDWAFDRARQRRELRSHPPARALRRGVPHPGETAKTTGDLNAFITSSQHNKATFLYIRNGPASCDATYEFNESCSRREDETLGDRLWTRPTIRLETSAVSHPPARRDGRVHGQRTYMAQSLAGTRWPEGQWLVSRRAMILTTQSQRKYRRRQARMLALDARCGDEYDCSPGTLLRRRMRRSARPRWANRSP